MSGMRSILSCLTLLAWSLWFGGMLAMVFFVQMLFAKNRPVALDAAPILFVSFGTYQLFVGSAAIVAALIWRFIEPRKVLTGIIVLFILASAGAISLSTVIVPRMEKLRAAGERESVEFKGLHKRSTTVYMAEMIALLIAGCMFPGAMRTSAKRPSDQTVEATAEESVLPAAAAD